MATKMTKASPAAPAVEIDRSRDITQPLEKLAPEERLKFHSDYLAGTIADDLVDGSRSPSTRTTTSS